MYKSTFKSDLEQSLVKEKLFEYTLNQYGFATTNTSTYGRFPGYDVAGVSPTGVHSSYELKYDIKASTSQNVCTELFKTINGVRIPSGITSTSASYYVYCFPNDDSFYLIPTIKLLQLIQQQKYNRFIEGAGDGQRTAIVLFEKSFFISHCDVL